MKKYSLLALVVLIALQSSTFAFAQDTTPVETEMGEVIVVSGLDFTLAYPAGWVHDIGQRVAIAENAEDLAAMTDNDDATQPAGLSLTLSSVPKTALSDALSNDDPTLDEVAALVTGSVQVDSSFDLPIMARRAYSFTGINSTGRWGIGSIWEMDDTYLVLGMGTPETGISDESFQFYSAITAAMKQFGDDPIQLAEDAVGMDALGLVVPFPLDWTPNEITDAEYSGLGFFANAADLARWTDGDVIEQAAIFVLSATTEDATDLAGLTAREAADSLSANLVEVSVEGEFLVGAALGFGLSGLREDGVYVYLIAMPPTDDHWTIFTLTAPDRETGEAAVPTFIAMLKGIEVAE